MALLQVNSNQAKRCISAAVRANLVTMLAGSPGIGKSSIVHSIADEWNLKVIDIRLAQCDPTDLNGFPNVNQSTGKASYYPMDTFPVEDDLPPINLKTNQPYDGWLLFLDEFNSADRGVQKAAYKLVLDKAVGQFKLHENVAIICAGNLDTDGAIVEEMSSALLSRLVHLEMVSDPTAWLEWASTANINHMIRSFIAADHKNLNTFDPDSTGAEKTYACERTWHFSSQLMSVLDVDGSAEEQLDLRTLLAGTVSEGMAIEFLNWIKVYKDLATIQEIIANPSTAKIPTSDNPGAIWAQAGSVASHASWTNLAELIKYTSRFPKEFQVTCIRDMLRRAPELKTAEPITDWIADNAIELF